MLDPALHLRLALRGQDGDEATARGLHGAAELLDHPDGRALVAQDHDVVAYQPLQVPKTSPGARKRGDLRLFVKELSIEHQFFFCL